jgi:hypothetical protein
MLSSSRSKQNSNLGLQPSDGWLVILGFILLICRLLTLCLGRILNYGFPGSAFLVGIYLYQKYPITPGPMEVVSNGTNGILIPPRDRFAIEQALEPLINGRPYLEQLRFAAQDTAQHYSWDRIARDNLAFYEEVLFQKRGFPKSVLR